MISAIASRFSTAMGSVPLIRAVRLPAFFGSRLLRRFFPGICAACAVGGVALFAFAQGPATAFVENDDALFAACRHDAGIISLGLVSNGVDIRNASWRQDRDMAILACDGGFPDLNWLLKRN